MITVQPQYKIPLDDMHKQLKIAVCIFIISFFQPAVQSYRIYQLDTNKENELIPQLKELLNIDKSDDSGSVHDGYVRKEKRSQEKPFGKSMFVKRIIPHGYKGAEYEYDSKLNTIYKPMVRYHIRKPIAEHEKDILEDIGNDRKVKDGFNDALIVLVKKDKNDKQDRNNPKDLLRQIKKLLNNKAPKKAAPKKKLKKRFRGLLGTMKKDEIKLLRSLILEKSGEHHDPYAPGNFPTFLEETQEEEKPKFTYPNYPFWNYWTYQKNIIQDECKGNLVKVGNMCVGSIGHRKSLTPIKKAVKSMNPRKFTKARNNVNLKK